MEFNLTSEQAMIFDSALRLSREPGVIKNRAEISAATDGMSWNSWRNYADLGWLAVTIPEDAGGLGGSIKDLIALMRGLGPAMILEPLVTSSVLAAAIIDQASDAGRRHELLGEIVAGRMIVALAHDEATDLAGVSPVTAQAMEGGGYRIDGVKTLCLHGPCADHLLVTARIGGGDGIGIFLVDTKTSGIMIDAYRLLDGTMAADIHFAGLEVDARSLLVDAKRAALVVEHAIDRSIVAMAAEAVGMMEQLLEVTSDYLKTRVQFGKSLSQQQVLRHRISEMFIRFQDAVSILHCAADHIDSQRATRVMAVSSAKILIAKAGRFIGGQAIQLHGAIGLTQEHEVGQYYLRFLVFERMFGDANFHLERYESYRLQAMLEKS